MNTDLTARKVYLSLLFQMLRNVEKDPTEVIKREARNILMELKRKEYINDKQYYRLKPCDGPPPRFYGLPKIHKQGNPIRPIVSCTGTPLYNLSKFVASILSKFTVSDYSKNSKEFSEYIREIKIADNECMVSFDVTSLYTSVPIKDTLNIIIENDVAFGEKTKIPVPDFLRLVELLLTKTWYLFNKNFYTQTDRVAMGGLASSVVAEIYMQAHETAALLTSDRRPKVWKRFVDDVFAIIKRSHLEEFHEHINGLHQYSNTSSFKKYKIKCILNSKDTLRSTLSKPKDKINMEEQNNVVYEIPCKDCDAVYIGETKRKFKQRVQEHMCAVRNGDVKKNEIADHSWSRSHQFNWDEKKIIDRESRTTARKIKETINSVERNKHINSISYQLPEIWLPALQKK
ncbi:uncharacterized protein LOC130629264 [Hydractinia symbiolongicarpus]|uniref:uncharacterized protein LOC130629264 n=1 Tax=Hydractinia symbiolongicarpus TaxID=13093 RepID=UPI002550E54B|nr:uncharacterized protein LOC130629264 [Hydractinia symbiolongicarpus]